MKMEQSECSETLEYKIQTPGNYPEENIQHDEISHVITDSLFFQMAQQLNVGFSFENIIFI